MDGRDEAAALRAEHDRGAVGGLTAARRRPRPATLRHGIRIGISGWRYKGWRGTFYPSNLPQRAELEYASRRFSTIEINGTFYSLQRTALFRAWREAVPEDFIFSLKGGRYITHLKRLKEFEGPLANFFASGLLALGPKLGPVLWQLPPNFGFDAARLDAFLAALPRTTGEAARLAGRHDRRVKDPCIEAERDTPLRHALEVRHSSFCAPEFVDLLRRHGVALVVADTVSFPYMEDVTADFVYLRLHGSEELYVSGYDEDALDDWSARIRAWAAGGQLEDRYCVSPALPPRGGRRGGGGYFDNDAKVRAPFDAMGLASRIGPG